MRNKLSSGICPKCEVGFLQLDREAELVLCLNCTYKISSTEFESLLEEAYKREYHEPTYDENLYQLNNL